MNNDKKIEKILLEKSQESFEKTKQLKIRSYQRDLNNVNKDLDKLADEYAELAGFAKEYGLSDFLEKEINQMRQHIADQTQTAVTMLKTIDNLKQSSFSKEFALRQYAFRHEADLTTPRNILTDYEDAPKSTAVKEASTALMSIQQESLLEQVCDGVESLSDINDGVETFTKQQKYDKEHSRSNSYTQTRSLNLLSGTRATQRLLMVKNMNRIIDKIDALNEQQEKIMTSEKGFFKKREGREFINEAKNAVDELKLQFQQIQMKYEDSLMLSQKERMDSEQDIAAAYEPDITGSCLDNLIHEAVERHAELCKEAEQIPQIEKERSR